MTERGSGNGATRARIRLLIVDDDPDLARLVAASLPGVQSTHEINAESALVTFGREEFDVVLTDVQMPGMNGIQLCERLVATRPDVPVIVLTSHGRLDVAVEAMRAGAFDFLTKAPEIAALRIAVERAAQTKALRTEVKRLREEVRGPDPESALIGESASMRQLRATIERIAPVDSSVLITGESGTGKEVVAQLVHKRSKRSSGPFVAINCAAMPENLLESELFGHVKGAFTDARAPRVGLFAQANGGTLFLDEIGDMPASLQPKLLRVLQERKIRPIGSNAEITVDVRIVSATNKDLEDAIAAKTFREDLYFRLNVLHLPIPPLRTRGSDALLLARSFVERFATRMQKDVKGISRGAAEKILAYSWPGNVRELQNCMERAVALTQWEEIAVEDLPEKVAAYRPTHVVVASEDPTELVTMDEVERRYVLKVLDACGGSRTTAAKVLGFDRKTLYRKLLKYGVSEKEE
ncbi:MAG: sigma-54-dependent transcriptional regulator [Polyangiales bacterium]